MRGFLLCLFTAISATGCGCSETGLQGQADALGDTGLPDPNDTGLPDLADTNTPDMDDDPPDVAVEPDIPEMLLECEEPTGAWANFVIDGTDWPRESIHLELQCETYGSSCSDRWESIRLNCITTDGVVSYHTLDFGVLPGIEDFNLLDLMHFFNYSATTAFRASRFFTFSAPWGELSLAGVESDTHLESGLVVGPFRLFSVRDSCEIDESELGDPERIAVNVVCGSTVVSVFDGASADIDCPEPYRIIVDEAVIYHSPEEYGPYWPERWTSVLVMRVGPS